MHKRLLYPAPLLILLVPFGAGIFFAKDIYGVTTGDYLWLSILFFFCQCFFLLPFINISEDGSPWFDIKKIFVLFVCLILSFVLGFFHFHASDNILNEQTSKLIAISDDGKEHIFTGILLTVPIPVDKGCRAIVLISSEEEPGSTRSINEKIAITFYGISWQNLIPGTAIRFAARLRKIRNIKTPGTFDFENWWALRGIKVKGFCSSGLKLASFGSQDQRNISIRHLLDQPGIFVQKLRYRIIRSLSFFFRQPDAMAVAIALTVGERAWFGPDLRKIFSSSGLGHLFAVSGLHMAIVGLLAWAVTRFLLSLSHWALINLPVRAICYSAASLFCFIYAALAGFSPSSTRAFIMVFLLGISFILKRPFCPENSLSLAGMLLLLISPWYLFDISFQLSFCVVFFLILYGRFFERQRYRSEQVHKPFSTIWIDKVKDKLLAFLFITVVAFFVASPLISFYFHRFSFLGIPLNLVGVPLTEIFILPILLSGIPFIWLSPEISHFFWNFSLETIPFLLKLAHLSSLVPLSKGYILPPSIWQLCLILCLLLLLPYASRLKSVRKAVLLIGIALFVLTLSHRYQRNHRYFLTFHCLDVGQGLCQVVEFPEGQIMVIDAGGFRSKIFDSGDRIVAPYLRRLGVTKIDILAVSHPEQDHVGGVSALLEQFEIGELWLNSDENPELDSYKKMWQTIIHKNIVVKIWRRSGKLPVGDYSEISIFPCIKCPYSFSRNDRCLVFKVDFKGKSILIPGDIGRTREMKLLRDGKLKADVLVIPHHGSNTSSSPVFLSSVHPRIAICSTGFKNLFGLPSEKVLARYKNSGIPILRTDFDGTVDIRLYPGFKNLGIVTFARGRYNLEDN